ncbi:MAG: anthranilate synthase component I family protein, partial [Dehalococcoidales bacterium]|nr:anthranilate synthase component I family protein [Dehalococcoidales bacterium]
MSDLRPLVEVVRLPEPALCFENLAPRPYSFFLDSGMTSAKLGRYSFIGAEPFLVLRSKGGEITILEGGRKTMVQGNPFDVLGQFLERYRVGGDGIAIPFLGGAVGYFAYDLCHFIEKLPRRAVDDLNLPDLYFAFYDAIIAFDHLEGQAYLVATGFPETGAGRISRARERLKELQDAVKGSAGNVIPAEARVTGKPRLAANFSHDGYLRAVTRAREYIGAGDIFQVNLSQRFDAEIGIPPYELYRRLRRINPAPFAGYLNFDGVAIVSASPERFLKLRGDEVETRPIKGTRPRGRTPEEDRRRAEELLASVKDRAENVMIVDLERNDLGRVCRYGTVRVTELCVLETYPTVFHLVSTVVGRLAEGKTRIDLLKATFPGGSITGAPKVRAMEIIDELEPTCRSVYTGSLGYLSFSGDMDINIVIRTFIIRGDRAYF